MSQVISSTHKTGLSFEVFPPKKEDEFENVGDLSPFLEEYNSLLISKDKEVVLTADNIDFPDNPYTARGITKTGALIVEDKMGKSHDISFGEVSVRGLLGYV